MYSRVALAAIIVTRRIIWQGRRRSISAPDDAHMSSTAGFLKPSLCNTLGMKPSHGKRPNEEQGKHNKDILKSTLKRCEHHGIWGSITF